MSFSLTRALDIVSKASEKAAEMTDTPIIKKVNELISVITKELKEPANQREETQSVLLQVSLYTICVLLDIRAIDSMCFKSDLLQVIDQVCELLELLAPISFITSLTIDFPSNHNRYNLESFAKAFSKIQIDKLIIKNNFPKSLATSIWQFDFVTFEVESWRDLDPIIYLIGNQDWPATVPKLHFICKSMRGELQPLSVALLTTFFEKSGMSVCSYLCCCLIHLSDAESHRPWVSWQSCHLGNQINNRSFN